MNAQGHADTAAELCELAQKHWDHGLLDVAATTAQMAQTHALTSVALSLTDRHDRGMVDELVGGAG